MPYNIPMHIYLYTKECTLSVYRHRAVEKCTEQGETITSYSFLMHSQMEFHVSSCSSRLCMSPCIAFRSSPHSQLSRSTFAFNDTFYSPTKWTNDFNLYHKSAQFNFALPSINICGIDFCWKAIIIQESRLCKLFMCSARAMRECFMFARKSFSSDFDELLNIISRLWFFADFAHLVRRKTHENAARFGRRKMCSSMIKCWCFSSRFGFALTACLGCPHTHHESFANSYFCNFNLIDQFTIRWLCSPSFWMHAPLALRKSWRKTINFYCPILRRAIILAFAAH